MNGTNARLTINIQNVIVRLQGFLPDIVMKDVIVVLTNAYRYAANAELKEALKDLPSTVYPFYMQNSAFSSDPLTWDEDARIALQNDWNLAMKELKSLVNRLDTFGLQPVQVFTDMKAIRGHIKSMMHAARLEVEKIQQMQEEIAAIQAGLKGFDDDITRNKSFTKKVEVQEIVPANHYNTICSTCNNVCHEKCGVAETFKMGDLDC